MFSVELIEHARGISTGSELISIRDDRKWRMSYDNGIKYLKGAAQFFNDKAGGNYYTVLLYLGLAFPGNALAFLGNDVQIMKRVTGPNLYWPKQRDRFVQMS